MNISVTADGSLLSPTGCVNTIHPEPEIHEQMTDKWLRNDKWLRKSVYDDKHTSNIGETIVDNYVNDATHVDAHKMQFEHTCMRSVVALLDLFTSHSTWLKPFALVFHSHPIHRHAQRSLSVFSPSLSTSCSTSSSSSSSLSS